MTESVSERAFMTLANRPIFACRARDCTVLSTWFAVLSLALTHLFVATVVTANAAQAAAQDGDAPLPVVVAVLPVGPRDASFALIEAELITNMGAQSGYTFVERERIDLVLRELETSLAGAAADQRALKAGRLLGAQALVIIEAHTTGQEDFHRIIVTDVHTGSRLGDLLVLPEAEGGVTGTVGPRVEAALCKLSMPFAERRYVGIIGLRSEEPGRMLVPHAEQFTRMLEHDLTMAADVIVLERTYLSRIMDESELTGSDLNIRESSLLLEGGVRREKDGQNLSVTLRAWRMGDGTSRYLTASARLGNVDEMRARLVDVVLRELRGAAKSVHEPAASEARLLADGAVKLSGAGQRDRALAMAKASLALAFTPTAARVARGIYLKGGVPGESGLQQRLKACEYDLMLVQYLLQTGMSLHESDIYVHAAYHLGAYLDNQPNAHQLTYRDVLVGEAARSTSDDDKIRREILETKAITLRLALEHFDRQWDALSRQERDCWLRNWLEVADQICTSADNLREIVVRTVERLEEDVVTNDDYSGVGSIWTLYQLAYRAVPGLDAPLLDWLVERPEPVYQLMGYRGRLNAEDSQCRLDAAREVLRRALGSDMWRKVKVTDQIVWDVRRLLDHEQFMHCIDSLLVEAEADGNIRDYPSLVFVLSRASKQDDLDRLKRIRALLHSQQDLTEVEQSALDHLDKAVRACETRMGIRQAEKKTPDIGEWGAFEVTPIPLDADTGALGSILYVHGEDRFEPDDVVVVWKGRGGVHVVTSVEVSSGAVRELGRIEQLKRTLSRQLIVNMRGGRQEMCSVRTEGAFYLGGGAGLLVVADGKAKVLREEDGLPSNSITHMAVCGGKLFIVHPGAMSLLDLHSKQVEVLATDRAVAPRNELDGKKWRSGDLTANVSAERVWFTLRGSPDVQGLWMYDSLLADLTRISKDFLDRFYWEEGELMAFDENRVCRESGRVAEPSALTFTRIGYIRDLSTTASFALMRNRAVYTAKNGTVRYIESFAKKSAIKLPIPAWNIIVRHGPHALAAGKNTLWLITYQDPSETTSEDDVAVEKTDAD